MISGPDAFFVFEKVPGAYELYEALAEKLRQRLPGMWEKVGRTEVAFYLGHRFGCASLLAVRRKAERPAPYLTVSFGLAYPRDSPPRGRQDRTLSQSLDPPPDCRLGRGAGRGAFGLAGGGRGFCRVKKSKKLLT